MVVRVDYRQAGEIAADRLLLILICGSINLNIDYLRQKLKFVAVLIVAYLLHRPDLLPVQPLPNCCLISISLAAHDINKLSFRHLL